MDKAMPNYWTSRHHRRALPVLPLMDRWIKIYSGAHSIPTYVTHPRIFRTVRMPWPPPCPSSPASRPSPTGYLHIGGAAPTLFNWLYAKHNGGKFLLRIEDTDRARSTDEAIKAILDGLKWRGTNMGRRACLSSRRVPIAPPGRRPVESRPQRLSVLMPRPRNWQRTRGGKRPKVSPPVTTAGA